MTAKQSSLYKQMSETLIAEIREGVYTSAQIVITKMLRLSQITAGIIQPDESETPEIISKNDPKNKEILAILEQTEDQIVVWCRFRLEINYVKNVLQEKGYKVGVIYGDVDQPTRAKNIDRWRKGEDRVIVCQVATAGMGITLLPSDVSKGITVIYRTNDFSLNNRLQSQDRTHRIGLKRSVAYIDLVCPKTIDVSIFNSLQSKKELAESVLDGKSITSIINGG